ncbi:hypothetical protein BG004_007413, partial [Podila humilis]
MPQDEGLLNSTAPKATVSNDQHQVKVKDKLTLKVKVKLRAKVKHMDPTKQVRIIHNLQSAQSYTRGPNNQNNQTSSLPMSSQPALSPTPQRTTAQQQQQQQRGNFTKPSGAYPGAVVGTTSSASPRAHSRSDQMGAEILAGEISGSQSSQHTPSKPFSVLSNPSPRTTPPSLPPARAHGVHARPLVRPGVSMANSSFPSPLVPAALSSVSSASLPSAVTKEDTPLKTAPGSQPVPLPAVLQAPKRIHQPYQQQQPRERTSASPVRSSISPAVNTRPAPPPSRLSSSILLASQVKSVQPSSSLTAAPPSSSSTASSASATSVEYSGIKPSDRISSESNRDDSNESTDNDEQDLSVINNPTGRGKESERPKKSRQRKMRKSLEKLTRRSIEKKRLSRQMRPLTTVSPPISPTHTQTPKQLDIGSAAPPKRLSLWASIFGNGGVEIKPEAVDSMAKNSGSMQSPTNVPPRSSTPQQTASPLTLQSTKSHSSDAVSTESSTPQGSSNSAEHGATTILTDPLEPPSINDISVTNVTRNDRTRTLPAILPSNILWSLSRVLGTKKDDGPLDSDTSDTDSTDDTDSDNGSAAETTESTTTTGQSTAENASEPTTEHQGTSTEITATTKSDPMATAAHTTNLQRVPSMPEKAALAGRINISRDRVAVAEAQVLIGEEHSDENDPFTDSHALSSSSGTSPSSVTKDQFQKYAGSTPSPSLTATTLSYLTGASASGTTWSLQSSGQSLMKRIFKSKNGTTVVTTPDQSSEPSSTSSPSTPALTPTADTAISTQLRGSTSPSASFGTVPTDPFSDFDQESNTSNQLDGLASISTGAMKRRSFIIPGAFPGFGARQSEEGTTSEEHVEPEQVPMYSPSEDMLVAARPDTTKRRSYAPNEMEAIWPQDEPSNPACSDSLLSSTAEKSVTALSTQELELPRYYPASPTRRPRAYSQHLTHPIAGVHTTDTEPASLSSNILKERKAPIADNAAHTSSSRSPVTRKKESGHSGSSPSDLSVAQAPTSSSSLSSPLAAEQSVVSPITPPLFPVETPHFESDLPEGNTTVFKEGPASAFALDKEIDYTRYKAEITESNYSRYSWPRGENPYGSSATQQETDSSDMSGSNVGSDQSSGSSPLVVAVISSGIRSSVDPPGPIGGSASVSSSTGHGVAPKMTAPPHSHSHQTIAMEHHHHHHHNQQNHHVNSQPASQTKHNPPPLPPPRNARRPRSKTLGKPPSRDKLGGSDGGSSHTRSISSAGTSSSNSPWDEPSSMRVQAPTHAPHLTMVLTSSKAGHGQPVSGSDIPGKEVIMEEMGSSEARNLNEDDYHFYQTEKRRLEVQTTLPRHQQPSNAWSTSSQQSDPSSANDSLLVATLRDQIASLASERDQFYQEAMLLRQKHDMLSNIVNNMGVAVESMQVQQQQQQQQQQLQSQAMGPLATMTVPVMTSSTRGDPMLDPSSYPHLVQPQQQFQHGHLDYSGQPFHQETQSSQFNVYQQQQGTSDQYLQSQEQLQHQLQLQQHRRALFQESEADLRVRQLSDEYAIQISRNSEDFGSRDIYMQQQEHQQQLQDQQQQQQQQQHQQGQFDHGGHNLLGYGQVMPEHGVHTGFMEDASHSYLGMNADQQQLPHQSQYQQEQALLNQQVPPQQIPPQQAPLMFGEGYDLLSSNDNTLPEPQTILNDLIQLDYNQTEDEQRMSGPTLQQLKLQHQQNQDNTYRQSTDTRHSSRESSMDGFQLTDIITTRPMSNTFVIPEPTAGQHNGPDYGGYGYSQQRSIQMAEDVSAAPQLAYPAPSHGNGRPLSFREQSQHHNHVQQELDQCPPGSHLRRHHSMIQPQTVGRQSSSSLDLMQQHQQQQHQHQQQQQQQQQQQHQHQQQVNRGRHQQARPPTWIPSSLNRASSTGSNLRQHQRQLSNTQQEIHVPVKRELLLLSSSTSFLNNNDMYGVESPPLSSAGVNNHSLLSAVVQQEKVRIEEKTLAVGGAAGWTERPSPMISKKIELKQTPTPPSTVAAISSGTTLTTERSREADTDKIREQFDSYLTDIGWPQQNEVTRASNDTRQDPDGGRSVLNVDSEDVDSDTDSDDLETATEKEEQDGEESINRQTTRSEGVTGSSIAGGGAIGRSKTVATTGIGSHHHHKQQQQQQQQHERLQKNQEDISGHATVNVCNLGVTSDGSIRHRSSSGSLRSVARHSEQRRGIPVTADAATTKTGAVGVPMGPVADKGAPSTLSTLKRIE